MAHLSNFGVGNFRSFKETYNFDFRPITILTGTNSSGKSSLTKSLLLIRESLSGIGNAFDELRFTRWNISSLMKLKFNSKVQLGNFDTAKNFYTKNQAITFELPFKLPDCTNSLRISLSYENDRSEKRDGALYNLVLYNPLSNEKLIEIKRNSRGYTYCYNYEALWCLLSSNQKMLITLNNLKDSLEKEVNKYELNYSDLDKSDLEVELPESILKIKKQFMDLEGQVPLPGDYIGDNWSSLSSKFIYYNNINNRVESNEPIWFNDCSLLNYLFLYQAEDVEKNIHDWYPELSQSEIDTLLMDYYTAQRIIGENKKGNESFSEVVRNWEFQALQKSDIKQVVSTDLSELDFSGVFNFLKNLHQISFKSSEGKFSFEQFKKGHKVRGNILSIIIEDSDTPLADLLKNENLILDGIPKGVKYPDYSVGKYFLEGFLFEGVQDMFAFLKKAFDAIEYIPSVRTKVDRFYKNSPGESFFHQCIEDFQSAKIEGEAMKFFERYIQIFEIADQVNLKISEDSAATRIELIKDGHTLQLADVGYGYSQILPLILKICIEISRNIKHDYQFNSGTGEDELMYTHHKPSILIIEEPETNLHPALQSKIADMLVDCYKEFNIQLIVETHSEYLVRKLQYLTGKKEIKPDLTQIYYFYPPNKIPEGEKQIKKINIQLDGSLTDDFGTGFFDESDKIAISLFNFQQSQKN